MNNYSIPPRSLQNLLYPTSMPLLNSVKLLAWAELMTQKLDTPESDICNNNASSSSSSSFSSSSSSSSFSSPSLETMMLSNNHSRRPTIHEDVILALLHNKATTMTTTTTTTTPSPVSSSSSSSDKNPVATTTTATSSIITHPRSSDVLLGKHKIIKSHMGNTCYHGIIEEFRVAYEESSTTKLQKMELSKRILQRIQSKGGRFLKEVPQRNTTTSSTTTTTTQWIEVSDQVAKAKIAHSFRNLRRK